MCEKEKNSELRHLKSIPHSLSFFLFPLINIICIKLKLNVKFKSIKVNKVSFFLFYLYYLSIYNGLILIYVTNGRRGSVASSEVCPSGVASSNCYYELSHGRATGIQLIFATAETIFPSPGYLFWVRFFD